MRSLLQLKQFWVRPRNLRKFALSSIAMANFPYTGTTETGLTKDVSITLPYGNLAGKTWGDESNEPVLCLHGFLDNCNTFDKLIPLLSKDKFYVAVDFPGHGLSSHIAPGSWYSNVEYFACMKRVVDHFKWEKFSLIGHSLGGNISGYFSALYPELVKKCVVIDALGVFVSRSEQISGSYIRSSVDGYLKYERSEKRPPKVYTYDEAKTRLLQANSDLTDEALDILLQRSLKLEDGKKFTFRRDFRHLLANPHVTDVTTWLAVLGNIKADTVIIHANQGLVMLLKSSEAYKKLTDAYMKTLSKMDNIKIVSAEGKHHLHLCDPNSVASILNDHLSDKHKSSI